MYPMTGRRPAPRLLTIWRNLDYEAADSFLAVCLILRAAGLDCVALWSHPGRLKPYLFGNPAFTAKCL